MGASKKMAEEFYQSACYKEKKTWISTKKLKRPYIDYTVESVRRAIKAELKMEIKAGVTLDKT